MLETKITILYIDDEENNCVAFKALFRKNYKVLTANSGEEGLNMMKTQKVNVVICDQRMAGQTGTETLVKISNMFKDEVLLYLVSGYQDIKSLVTAVNEAKIRGYFEKPFDTSLIFQKMLEAEKDIMQLENILNLKKMNQTLNEQIEKFRHTR